MSRLTVEPIGDLRSVGEVARIAAATKRDAAQAYRRMAMRMESANPPVAAVLRSLAEEEAQGLEPTGSPAGVLEDAAAHARAAPGAFDDEGLAEAHPHLVDERQVLAMAVRNSERAFAYWSYMAARAGRDEVRQAAESMAHAQLRRVAALRRRRRAAFHEERAARREADDTSARRDLAEAERKLAVLVEQAAASRAGDDRLRLQETGRIGREHAAWLDGHPGIAAGGRPPLPTGADALGIAEFLTDAYLAAAEGLQDEDLMREAQRMAGRSVERLAWLRSMLIEPGG